MPSSEAMASSLGRSSELTKVVTVPAVHGWGAGQVGVCSGQRHVPTCQVDSLPDAAGLQTRSTMVTALLIVCRIAAVAWRLQHQHHSTWLT